jgi:16S rRNA (guanine966-N2)-methyltransferase
VRIIAGKWRGRPLAAPTGAATRPTADRVREALFSMLTSRLGSFEGLAVADIFAGTGALGLEALSRGAARATFVENERGALAALRGNVSKLGADFDADVLAVPAQSVPRAREPHHLLFLDPPYDAGLALPTLARLGSQGWIAPQALVSVETSRTEELAPPGFEIDAVREHGKARLHLLRFLGE